LRVRKTDYGTIILHWLMVAAFAVALFTGLRIATEIPGRRWLNLLDRVLPSTTVWTTHMEAAIGLVAVTLGYVIYMNSSGLSRRIRLDRIALHGLFRKRTRAGSFSIVLNWVFFSAMLVLIVSGAMLYFGIDAGRDVAALHWYATWVTVAFAGLHVVTHFRIGGASQLLRIFRPAPLPARSPQLDPVELLTMLVEQSARLAPEFDDTGKAPLHELRRELRRPSPNPTARPRPRTAAPDSAPTPRNPTFYAHPLVVALAVAITGASLVVAADRLDVEALRIHRIGAAEAPALDGDTSDRAWRNAEPYSVMTSQGGNFDGKGETRIEIRAVHDGTWAYFLFTWDDPTRSLKELPLVKQADGWHVMHNGFETGDEHDYNEDKFSVVLTTSDSVLAGDHTFHAGPHPVADAPSSMTGRGMHFTAVDAGIVDVWEWKATSGGPTGWAEDAHFGPPLPPTPMQVSNMVPYRGGFAPDPGTANYSLNFVNLPDDLSHAIQPRRLPTNLAATAAAMGEIDNDPDHGESDGARWFMTEAESAPYSAVADKIIPVGTVIPGIITAGEFVGDRADVRSVARWASGHWALEVARRLDTGSEYDVPLRSGVFMRVAAFDHSQIRHTRHTRPIRIEVE
jgi:hypothetical protein